MLKSEPLKANTMKADFPFCENQILSIGDNI